MIGTRSHGELIIPVGSSIFQRGARAGGRWRGAVPGGYNSKNLAFGDGKIRGHSNPGDPLHLPSHPSTMSSTQGNPGMWRAAEQGIRTALDPGMRQNGWAKALLFHPGITEHLDSRENGGLNSGLPNPATKFLLFRPGSLAPG